MSRRRTWFTAALDAVLVVGLIGSAVGGGWRLIGLLLVPWLLWDLYRYLRPAEPRGRADLSEPGEYRVVLQVPGPNPIMVIREVRRATGKDLLAAKQIIDDWPSVVAEGLSAHSAGLLAENLRQAGAKAVAAPIGEM